MFKTAARLLLAALWSLATLLACGCILPVDMADDMEE